MVRMQSPKREVAPLAQAPALIYAVALTCGVLASLASLVGHRRPRLPHWRNSRRGTEPSSPALATVSPAAMGGWRRDRFRTCADRRSQRRVGGRWRRTKSRGQSGGPRPRRRDGPGGSLRRRAALSGDAAGWGRATPDCAPRGIRTRLSCSIDQIIGRAPRTLTGPCDTKSHGGLRPVGRAPGRYPELFGWHLPTSRQPRQTTKRPSEAAHRPG